MDRLLYEYSTMLYLFAFFTSLVLMIYFIMQRNILLMILSVLMMIVCADNFFCTSRMCNAGYAARGHYALPPFFENK